MGDTPPLPDTPKLGKLVDPIPVNEPLELVIKEPGELAVTGPVSAEVNMLPFGNIVSVTGTLKDMVITVITPGAGLVEGDTT
jgi:hypothetical protein